MGGAFAGSPRLQIRDPRIEHIAWAINSELQAEEPFGRLYAESLGVALCTHVLRQYAYMAPIAQPRALPKRRVQRAVHHIHERIDAELSLQELAAVADLSVSHFKAVFKEVVGMPVHRYVMKARVEYAVNLITLGRLPLCDVAARSGFANQSHMARCIRRMTGSSPSGLR